MNSLCIYHANCADGFTAAWILKNHYTDRTIDFFPGVYQDPPPDIKGRDVIFVDFSYKRRMMEIILNLANTVVIIDHHKTAIDDLACLPFTDSMLNPNHSGAMLTWMWAKQNLDSPHLVQYVEDRDLWKFSLPYSREINANIFSYDYTFENWDYLNDAITNDTFVEEGAAIERKHHKDVAELVRVTRRNMEIGGHIVPVANVPYTLTSDAGHLMATELCGGKVFSACYWDTPEGRVFSLRSTADGIDVSEIAKQYGGGGHSHASGFRIPFDQLDQKGLV